MLGNYELGRLNVASLIKASDIRFDDEYDSLCEKIVDYMELVREYIGDKCFFTLNLRSLISDAEAELLMKTLLDHEYHCIMIENCERKRSSLEKRTIIDEDLCEIC